MSPSDRPQVRVLRFEKELEHPFGIASITVDTEPGVLLQVGDVWSEAAPSRIYGESMDGTIQALERWASEIPTDGQDPTEFIDRITPELANFRSALSAIDTALHDLWGRAQGEPVWKLLGADGPESPISSFTIGIDKLDVMLEKVETVGGKSSVLKIKLGRSPDSDCEVMRAIRKAAPDKVLRVDANQGWTIDDAKRIAPILADLGVEYIEQPLRRGNFEDGKRLKEFSPLPIFADEDSHLAADIPLLAQVYHGVNIKLIKTGGLLEARRMLAAARDHDLQVMVGCMVETSAGITAAAQIAPLCDHVDLDGHVLITNDPFDGCGWDKGRLTLTGQPGMGVRLKDGVGL